MSKRSFKSSDYSWKHLNKIKRQLKCLKTDCESDTEFESDTIMSSSTDSDESNFNEKQVKTGAGQRAGFQLDCEGPLTDLEEHYEDNDLMHLNNFEDEEMRKSDFSDFSSETSESDEEDRLSANADPELYEGASMTVKEFALCVLALKMRHNLTDTCLSDILKLISNVCQKPNNCITSIYNLKKTFSSLQTPVIKHYYCSKCALPLNDTDSKCSSCINSTSEYFLEISLITQLQSMYKRPDFLEKIKYRCETISEENIYKDIYDGSLYKELSKSKKILNNEKNISFTWYSDGVSIFKSSKYNIWPFYLTVNEIPYSERFKMENVLLVGLWHGYKKPKPNVYLNPIKNSLEEIYKGVDIQTKLNDTIRVRGIVICGTCDLPAKAMFLNMNQFNGWFGCQTCKQRGESLGPLLVYPYEENIILRTDNETLLHATQAFESNITVCGVKGPSILSKFAYKYITSASVDVMHCVFEGVVKKLLHLWLDTKYSQEDFSISKFALVIDTKLIAIHPPAFVQRRPRALADHFNYWKASELKNWFFYYSIPILHNLLSYQYFEHYKLLVLAVYFLCQKVVTLEMVEQSSKLLKEFVSRFQILYGLEQMVSNVHQLRHLPEIVKRMGPLWTTSCFPYENLNGNLKTLVHSSNSAHLQIVSGVSLFINVAVMRHTWCSKNGAADKFCDTILSSCKQKKKLQISDFVFVVGKLHKLNNLPPEIASFFSTHNYTNIYMFKKLLKDNLLYTSTSYKILKTKSFYVKYEYDNTDCYGIAEYYIKICYCVNKSACNCHAEYKAVIQKVIVTTPFTSVVADTVLSFIYKITNVSNELTIIDVQSLKCVCIYVSTDTNVEYIIVPVNLIEKE